MSRFDSLDSLLWCLNCHRLLLMHWWLTTTSVLTGRRLECESRCYTRHKTWSKLVTIVIKWLYDRIINVWHGSIKGTCWTHLAHLAYPDALQAEISNTSPRRHGRHPFGAPARLQAGGIWSDLVEDGHSRVWLCTSLSRASIQRRHLLLGKKQVPVTHGQLQSVPV